MTTTQEVRPGEEFQVAFPLKDLIESKSNPREVYDTKKMHEMVESVKARGIVQALVGRRIKGGKVEIVCGSRRYRGAREAGLTTVPVHIKPLTDEAVLEIQLIENSMREDVHPLHEGLAYERLLQFPSYTVDVIAQKTGHEPKLIRQRLALAELIDAAAKLFLEDEINIGHANLLARLPASKQKEAMELLHRNTWQGAKSVKLVVSVKEFDASIREHLMLDLHSSPWKKNDELLDPKAGSCLKCSKRSGANTLLFDDLSKKDHCLDAKCYAKKADLFLIQVETQAKESGQPVVRISYTWTQDKNTLNSGDYQKVGKKKCSHAEQGLVVDGPEKGQIIPICRKRAECKTHWPHYAGSQVSKPDYWETRAAGLERTIKIETARSQLKAVIEHAPTFVPEKQVWEVPHRMMRVIGHALLNYSEAPQLAEILGVEGVKNGADSADAMEKLLDASFDEGFPRVGAVVYGLALSGAVKEYAQADDLALLAQSCEALEVDAKAIQTGISKSMKDEFNAKRKKSQAKKKAAAAKEAPKPAAKKKAAKR